MTEPREQQELLPGARARPASAAQARRRGRGRRPVGRRRPGRPGARRRAAGPPRPALRLRSSPRRWPTTRGRASGSRCGSPAATSTGSCSSGPPSTDHGGSLTPLRRVVSAEPVLLAAGRRAGRRRWPSGTPAPAPTCCGWPCRAGTPPPRRRTRWRPCRRRRYDSGAAEAAWADHGPAAAFLGHLAAGGSPRAVWSAAPGTDWPALVAHAVAATVAGGRGALVVRARRQGRRPGRRRADRACSAPTSTSCSPPTPVRRSATATSSPSPAGAGGSWSAPAPRRSRRSHDLGLVVIWDDGDDLHAEPRAPYPHAREMLLLRAEREGAAALVGGFATTVEAEQLVRTGWAHLLAASREELRARVTVVGRRGRRARAGPRPARPGHPAADRGAPRDPRRARRPGRCSCRPRAAATPPRWPASAAAPRPAAGSAPARWRSARPPRRRPAAGAAPPTRPGPAPSAATAGCGRRSWGRPGPPRSSAARFAGTVVRTSGGDRVLATVDDEPAIVVATPGAEPVAAGGYAAVVLLDTWLVLGLAHLRAEEEALRRWANAVGLVRPGGRVVVVGDPAHPAVQALVRWDPAGFAAREAARAPRGAPAAGLPAGDHHRRARRRRRRAHAARRRRPASSCSARCRSAPTASRGPSSACRAATAPTCPARWARCSGSARPASSTPSGSRSTRRRSEAAPA